jgi:hypothetical protein
MSQFYISQPIDLTLVCKINSSSLTWADMVSAVITYTKPDASTGTFTPGVLSVPSQTVSYAMSAAQNDQAGTWLLQVVATLTGAVVIPFSTIKLLILARYT